MGSIFSVPHLGSSMGFLLLLIGLSLAFIAIVYVRVKNPRQLPGGMLLRLMLIAVLGLVLSEPYSEEVSSHSKALALLDISDSVDESVAQSLLDRARDMNSEDLEISFLPFAKQTGKVPLLVGEAGSFSRVKSAWSKLDIGATDLQSALEQALSGGVGNVLLLTDGQETAGSFKKLLPQLRTSGKRIFPLFPKNESDTKSGVFRVSNLYAPLIAAAQKSVDVRVSVANTTNKTHTGTLEVKHDTKVILTQKVKVEPGKELLVVAPSDPSQEGIKEITATLTPDESEYPSSAQTIFISGEMREKILLVSGSQEDERFLQEALRSQAYQLDTVVATEQAGIFKDPSRYSVIILNNASLPQIGKGNASMLKHYVEDGGGFVMIGGNRGFGLGGYIDTAIEDILPVKLVPPQREEKRLNIAVELVLDKSRSMAEGNKIEFAKEAARETVRNLKDEDYIGVIGFDSSPFLLVPLGQLGSIRQMADERIGRLFPTGKTNLLPAMDEARRSLMRVNAGRKHVIILTDGQISDSGPHYLELVKQMRLVGITVSTVMLGSDAADGLLPSMAEYGGGAYYQTSDPRSLPRIFLADMKVASGERTMKEEREYVVRRGTSDIKSTSLQSFPPVRGYVQTAPRNGAALELVAMSDDKAEPLLASWNYSKGRSIAFTSDANARWSSNWVGWAKFQQFWDEVIETARGDAAQSTEVVKYDLRYYMEGQSLVLDMSVYAEAVSGQVTAEARLPDGTRRNLEFQSVSRGRFKATIEDASAGTYQLDSQIGSKRLTPVAFNLSGELFGEKKGLGFNRGLLQYLADESGGIVNPGAEELKAEGSKEIKRHELGTPLLLLALLLLMLEIFRRELPFLRWLRLPKWRLKRGRGALNKLRVP